MTVIDVVLDLRRYETPTGHPDAFVDLWMKLERAIGNNPLDMDQWYSAESEQGTVGFRPIWRLNGDVSGGGERHFAIRSLLVKPAIKYACVVCSRVHQQTRYGPLYCSASAAAGELVWLCDEHAVLLEGSTRAYHPDHVPLCSSKNGDRANFVCWGPACSRGRPWSEAFRKRDPRDAKLSYCQRCHAELFPPCSAGKCTRTGYYRCEYTDPETQRQCRTGICGKHTTHWQIYGPGSDKQGLCLCPVHRNLRALSDEQIILEMALGSAARRLDRRDKRPNWLPRLGAMHHIFLNVRDRSVPHTELYALAQKASRLTCHDTPLGKKVLELFAAMGPPPKPPKIPPEFETIRRAYAEIGDQEVADGLEFSYESPPNRDRPYSIYWLRINPDWIGHFFTARRQVQEMTGLQFNLERDQAGRRRGRR